jgi:hypothetical protein
MRYWIVPSIFNPIPKLRDLTTVYSGVLAERISILQLLKIIHTRLVVSLPSIRQSFVCDGGVGYLLTLSSKSRNDKDIAESIFDILLILLVSSRFKEIASKHDYISLLLIHESSIHQCIEEVSTLHKDNENIRYQANELQRALKQANAKLVLYRFQEAKRAFQLHLMPEVYQRAKSLDRKDRGVVDYESEYGIASMVKGMRNHVDNSEIQSQGLQLLTTYMEDELLFPSLIPFLNIDFIFVVISALRSNTSQLRLTAMTLLFKLTSNPNFITFFCENGGCCAFLELSKSYHRARNQLLQSSLWVLSNLCSQGKIICPFKHHLVVE